MNQLYDNQRQHMNLQYLFIIVQMGLSPRHSTLLAIIITLFFQTTCATTAIQKPPNIDAQKILLYNNTASMPNQQFNLTFKYAFTTVPVFVYGINDYKLGDQFAYQNFQSLTSGLTSTNFSINVTSVSSTNVKTFSISYFAAQPKNSFLNDFHNVTNGVNISTYTTASYRYNEYYVGFNFSSSSVYALPLLTGYYIGSSTYFEVNITASVISQVTYQYKIETSSDCVLNRITFYVLFCQKQVMDSNNYYYYGGLDVVQSYNPSSNTNFTYAVDNYNETVFLLGLRGFSGFTILTGCYWGWNITNVSNDTATLTISQKQLLYLQYSFFQIGSYIKSSNSTTTTASSSSGYLGIIVGIIVGIVITAVVIVTFLKFYWKRAILNLPTHDDFKQMPSISL